jgi:hypothetical protein
VPLSLSPSSKDGNFRCVQARDPSEEGHGGQCCAQSRKFRRGEQPFQRTIRREQANRRSDIALCGNGDNPDLSKYQMGSNQLIIHQFVTEGGRDDSLYTCL